MRAKTSFHCQACGHQSPPWLGRCPDCGAWNSLKEERIPGSERPAGSPFKKLPPRSHPIAISKSSRASRRATGIGEFDRVSAAWSSQVLILIGGDPGIGRPHFSCKPCPVLDCQEGTASSMSPVKSLRDKSRCAGNDWASAHRQSSPILAETSRQKC